MAHASLSEPETNTGLLPSWAIPRIDGAIVQGVVNLNASPSDAASEESRFFNHTTGKIRFHYKTFSGAENQEVCTGFFSISYIP